MNKYVILLRIAFWGIEDEGGLTFSLIKHVLREDDFREKKNHYTNKLLIYIIFILLRFAGDVQNVITFRKLLFEN